MPSPVFDLFRRAVQERGQIFCSYNGLERHVCPHAVGYSRTGVEMAMTYQFAGSSSKGLPAGGEWRCLELSRVRQAHIQEGDWHTGYRHLRPQTCVHNVVAEIAY